MRELAREIKLPTSREMMGCRPPAAAAGEGRGEASKHKHKHDPPALVAQLQAMKARARVMVQSDVEDARYDYEQRQLNYVIGASMCQQAWQNLVWLWEWGVAVGDGQEWLMSTRGVAGALRPNLDPDPTGPDPTAVVPGEEAGAEATLEKEWAPAILGAEFTPEEVSSAGGSGEYRLSITHGVVAFAEPHMAAQLSMVAADTLRLMIIIFHVLGDSIVGMSQPVASPPPVPSPSPVPRPATAPAARGKNKGKKKNKKKKQVLAQQTGSLGDDTALARSHLAEQSRLDRVRELQLRFVSMHVAEKTHSRKEHLLKLYTANESTTQSREGGRSDDGGGAVVSVEEAAELAVLGGQREIVMTVRGGNNVLLCESGTTAAPQLSQTELEKLDRERLGMMSEIVKAADSLAADSDGVVAAGGSQGTARARHSAALQLEQCADALDGGKISGLGEPPPPGATSAPCQPNRRRPSDSRSDYLQPEEPDEVALGKLQLHSETVTRIQAMCAEMRSERSGSGTGGAGGKKNKPATGGGSVKTTKKGNAPFKLTVLPPASKKRW